MLVLGAVVRFFHFALFGGPCCRRITIASTPPSCFLFAMAGFRVTRTRQMARQYGFLDRRP